MVKIPIQVLILIQRILQIRKKKSKHQILGDKACSGSAGRITYNVKKYSGGSKHSCIQDAAINAGLIFGFQLRNALYEEVPPKENEDTVISHVIKAKCLAAFMKFTVVDIQGKFGGPEYFIFKEVWKQGGLYIINCKFIGYYTEVTENHAFLYNADYTGPDNICHGSIVDNQKHTHLFGIEKSDVSSVAKAKNICNGLFWVQQDLHNVRK